VFRKELPRVYELRDLIADPVSPSAYFHRFDGLLVNDPVAKQIWLGREGELSGLDTAAWNFLKNEARPYLRCRDPERGWYQLVAILNQACAYNYLKGLGCSDVRFIPPATQKGVETPDLQAELNGLMVLCEVKTINVSKEEAFARAGSRVSTATDPVKPGFLNKLTSDLKKANDQIDSYAPQSKVRRIAYVVPNFDNLWGECNEQYFKQMDQHLIENRPPGIEIVFRNQKTAFHKAISMTAATVVNE
jgi:hypothetical protein